MLSTPEGIERLARERLGLVKPEEVVIYTIDEDNRPIKSQEYLPLATSSAEVE